MMGSRPALLAIVAILGSTVCALAESPVDAIDKLLAPWDRADAPGVAVVVIRDGEVLYKRGFGLASIEHGAAIRPDSVFYIASMSKQFTAAAVLLAAQAGNLSLDDGVRKFLPELPAYAEPITVRHLVHHTSGLRDYLWLMAVSGVRFENVYSESEILRLIARQKALNFSPGEEFSYSNSGYFLLSQIVKRATHKSLRAFADEKIFKPLEMSHTHFHDDPSLIVKNRVTGYARRLEGGYRMDWISHWDKVGDGNLLTTVDDLVRWDRNFDTGQVGGSDLLAKMVEPGRLNSGASTRYAAGLIIDEYKGLPTVAHGGAFMGFRTDTVRFPQQKLTVICPANLAEINPDKITRQIADLLLADVLKPKPRTFVDLPPAVLESKQGLYRDPASHMVVAVSPDGSRLAIEISGRRVKLGALDDECFAATDDDDSLEARFETETGGPDRALRVTLAGTERVYEHIVAVEPSTVELDEYTGEFCSDELRTNCKLTRQGRELVAKIASQPAIALAPTQRDRFRGGGMTFEFDRADQGIRGFRFDAARARGIEFVRPVAGAPGQRANEDSP